MKLTIRSEFPLILIVAMPFIYLWYLWDALPEQVPMHWNINGEIDRYGSKAELWIIPFALPFLIYVLMIVIPYIDPKKKIKEMGGKYQQIKFALTLFMSALAVYLIYTSMGESQQDANIIIAMLGGFYLILGNFMKTIKGNYFIGIRTPWTLENDTVWKDTHLLAGKLWLAGGLIIIIVAFFAPNTIVITFFIIITVVISLIPVVYSFFRFRQLQ